jgi:DnaJ-class molecular chaperone
MKNYVQAIRQLQKQIDEINAKARNEITPLQQALDVLKFENETCTLCDGIGHYGTIDAAGQREETTCEHCNGTGRK